MKKREVKKMVLINESVSFFEVVAAVTGLYTAIVSTIVLVKVMRKNR